MSETDDTAPPRVPAPPRHPLPEGACDSHAHVCGPADRFPPQPDAAYAPPEAPMELYLQTLDAIGARHGVVVQATPYGMDMSGVIDACRRSGGRLKGVGLALAGTSEAELAALAEAGVVGLRFAYFPPGVKDIGGVRLEAVAALAPAMRAVGMHAQLWAPCATLVEWLPKLTGLGMPLVLDHMARVTVADGVDAPAFRELLAIARGEDVWVKSIPHRVSTARPGYDDVRPFHEALCEAIPDRLLWGTDWPYVRMGDTAPDAGQLADLFHDWTPDQGLRRKVLVENPARLFGFA